MLKVQNICDIQKRSVSEGPRSDLKLIIGGVETNIQKKTSGSNGQIVNI
jgi:hypothetical protein